MAQHRGVANTKLHREVWLSERQGQGDFLPYSRQCDLQGSVQGWVSLWGGGKDQGTAAGIIGVALHTFKIPFFSRLFMMMGGTTGRVRRGEGKERLH